MSTKSTSIWFAASNFLSSFSSGSSLFSSFTSSPGLLFVTPFVVALLFAVPVLVFGLFFCLDVSGFLPEILGLTGAWPFTGFLVAAEGRFDLKPTVVLNGNASERIFCITWLQLDHRKRPGHVPALACYSNRLGRLWKNPSHWSPATRDAQHFVGVKLVETLDSANLCLSHATVSEVTWAVGILSGFSAESTRREDKFCFVKVEEMTNKHSE